MSKNIRFYIAEETYSEEEGSTIIKKCVDMKVFKKIIRGLLQNQFDEMNSSLQELTRTLKDEQSAKARIEAEIAGLKSQILDLQNVVNSTKEKIAPLVAAYNSQKANSFSKSKEAIDELYTINRLFKQQFSHYGRSKKLEVLQALVQFLYNPSDELEQAILSKSNDEKTISILSQIKRFNESLKPGLLSHLASENIGWDDCVSFPESNIYNSEEMESCTDAIEIAPGEPVYIVSLGLHFPNSNSEKQKPSVYKISK